MHVCGQVACGLIHVECVSCVCGCNGHITSKWECVWAMKLVQGVQVCHLQVRVYGMSILCRVPVCGGDIIWKGESMYCDIHAVGRMSMGRSVITYSIVGRMSMDRSVIMYSTHTHIYIYIVGCVCALGVLSVSGFVVCMLYEVCIPWARYGQVGNAYVYVWHVSVLSILWVGCMYICMGYVLCGVCMCGHVMVQLPVCM